VLLEVNAVGLYQLDLATHTVLASYAYCDVHAYSEVRDCTDGFVIICSDFSRMVNLFVDKML